MFVAVNVATGLFAAMYAAAVVCVGLLIGLPIIVTHQTVACHTVRLA